MSRLLGRKGLDFQTILLILIPFGIAMGVWFSALAFVPVPWPDDSAFYFVAKDLFHWPPRWIMSPQAPFEPTYRIFNFNTMPLYPILIGLGRFIGIDGSFLLKIWPLSAWALSGSLLGVVLYRMGLPFLAALLISGVFSLDPILRWASVLIRPESLIGFFGMALVLGLTFGFPKRGELKKTARMPLWDPVAALLALGAACHFNAIHLVFPVLFTFAFQPRRLMQIGIKTLLYLSPWFLAVVTHWDLFIRQMTLQWTRLSVPNSWLDSPSQAISNLFQNMGSPEGWPPLVNWVAVIMWVVFLIAVGFCLIVPMVRTTALVLRGKKLTHSSSSLNLIPASGWLLGAAWLFHSKPEVWFIYYFHAAFCCFCGLAALKIWLSKSETRPLFGGLLGAAMGISVAIFGWVDVTQAVRLGATQTWHWDTYYSLIDCVDDQLTRYQSTLATLAPLGSEKPFRVWCPTFPDITIELSRRHPDWELTRTNDFWVRRDLAIQHGKNVEAVVIPETVNFEERFISGPAEKYPHIHSTWMLWKDYFLNQLWVEPGWKPNRAICQRGRWQAFLFMD